MDTSNPPAKHPNDIVFSSEQLALVGLTSMEELYRLIIDFRKSPGYSETHYAFREVVLDDYSKRAHLLIPWGNPRQYEDPYDFLFDTPEEALAHKASDEAAAGEDWVLVKLTAEVIQAAPPTATEDGE